MSCISGKQLALSLFVRVHKLVAHVRIALGGRNSRYFDARTKRPAIAAVIEIADSPQGRLMIELESLFKGENQKWNRNRGRETDEELTTQRGAVIDGTEWSGFSLVLGTP